MAEEFSVVGKRLPRADALEKVTGKVVYTTDIQLPGMLHAKFLRSPHAHARIARIDTSKAEVLSGVKAVLTHKNVPKVHPTTQGAPGKFEYLLDETVHYAGEEIAAVAAVTEEIAEEALKFIEVEYEVLPAVFDKEEAMQPGAPLVHPELGDNLYRCPRALDGQLTLEWGDIDKGFAEAEYVVEGTYESPWQHHVSPEPRAAVCQWSGNNLTCWASTQKPQDVREELARCFSIPLSNIRVISTYSVGGYGSKHPEKAATLGAILAKKTDLPVRAVYTRAEDFIATHHRLDSKLHARVGLKKDGAITATHNRMIFNFGRDSKSGYLVPSGSASTTCSILYDIPNSKWEGHLVITNTQDHGAFNGFGDPTANFGIERLMDEAAEIIGMEPVEFRLRNCTRYGYKAIDVPPVMFGPIKWCIMGPDVDSLQECLRLVAEKADWKRKWKGWKTPMEVRGPKRRGIGISMGIHHCVAATPDSASIKMNRDGTADVFSSDPEIGQGLKSAMAQVVAEVLGLQYEDVNVVLADTSVTPFGPGVFASRGTTIGINAAYLAAQEIKRKLIRMAAEKLEVKPDDLEAKERRVYVKGHKTKGITIAELCYAGYQLSSDAVVPYPWTDPATGKEIVPESMAVTIAEVEVDTETGELEVLRLVSAHDCGRAINPTLIENQIDLSLTQANGWVRTENMVIDKNTGVMLNPNLLDYKIMTILDMPKMADMEEIIVEYPTTWGPFGAKGMSETAMTTPAPAIANAVYNAIGVRIRGDHLSPERILKALESRL